MAVVGIQHNPIIREHYARKRAAGKSAMYAVGHCMSKSLSMVWGVWRGGKDFDAAKPAGVGEQKSIQLGWPACSLPKTTQSERDTTCHNPTIPSARTSPEFGRTFAPPTRQRSLTSSTLRVVAEAAAYLATRRRMPSAD